jgi:hypothetical protein
MSRKYYYRVRSAANYNDLVNKSKDYKKTLQRKFNEYQKGFIAKLRGLRTTDPKSYWSLLNKKGCNKSNTVQQKVATSVFFDHFKNLNKVDNDVDVILPENVTV